MGREPNEALHRLITEAAWSYSQFARAVNRTATEAGVRTTYDDSAVAHWLTGTVPRPAARPCITEALSRRLGRPITPAEAGFPPPPSRGDRRAPTVETLADLGRHDMDPSRRSLLGAALFSVAVTIPAWPDVVARAEAVSTGRARRIGRADVRVVTDMTERISAIDDEYGGRTARPMAAAFLVNTVAPYLAADADAEVRSSMLTAAADLCYLTGYMAVDEGLHGLAQSYYLRALELAGAAGDHLTYCTTLRGMSVQAVDLGHSAHALRLADAAAAASPQAGPRMRAFLAGQQAHCAAQTGDRRAAAGHMRDAERAMEQAESRVRTFGSYDPAALHYHLSRVHAELGELAPSVEAARTADQLRHSVYRRNAVRTRALMAETLLRAGRLDEAVCAWHSALDDYPHVQSGRCDDRMRKMRRLLVPHSRNAGARELLERAGMPR